jgi:predicted nucleotidyltransferase
MNRHELAIQSEQCLRELLCRYLPPQTPVHIFGSRAREQHRWNSDYDLWIDADIDLMTWSKLENAIEESIIPFKVDIVTTRQLKGKFGDLVKQDSIRWI